MPTVLIVDDEKNIRATLARGLRLEGYRTEEAGDGIDALAAQARRTAKRAGLRRAEGGEFNFAHLNSSAFDRIEVVRGPQSALFGSDALGVLETP